MHRTISNRSKPNLYHSRNSFLRQKNRNEKFIHPSNSARTTLDVLLWNNNFIRGIVLRGYYVEKFREFSSSRWMGRWKLVSRRVESRYSTRNEVSKTGKRATRTLVERRVRSTRSTLNYVHYRAPGDVVPSAEARCADDTGEQKCWKNTGWETVVVGRANRQFLLWNVSDDSVYRAKLSEISFFPRCLIMLNESNRVTLVSVWLIWFVSRVWRRNRKRGNKVKKQIDLDRYRYLVGINCCAQVIIARKFCYVISYIVDKSAVSDHRRSVFPYPLLTFHFWFSECIDYQHTFV